MEAGVPEGVVNIITGFGPGAGSAIAEHPDIDKVAFTGSTEVGKLILQASAGNLKKGSLELGGKAPNIIFPDADLDQAVPTSMMGVYFNSGQVCCAGTRIFVQRDRYDEVVDKLANFSKSVTMGDPFDQKSTIGPLVSREQFDRVKGYLEVGKKEGAGGGGRWRGRIREGLLRQADPVLRRQERHADCARGDLRSGWRGDLIHGRKRCGFARQHYRLRALRRGLDARYQPRP
jgi:acyl-CoA reductase-like NAD-dependent aldehyde dehydrogenase